MLDRLKRYLPPAPPRGPDAEAESFAARPTPPGVSHESSALWVIDVRSEREFQATALERAANIPLPQLVHRIGELVPDKATPLVLYCASGARSGIGCGVLKQLGYTHVTNAGGLYAAAEQLQREVRR